MGLVIDMILLQSELFAFTFLRIDQGVSRLS